MSSHGFLQDIYPAFNEHISAISCHRTQLDTFLPALLRSIDDHTVGLAPIYGRNSRLVTLSIASRSQVLLVQMEQPSAKKNRKQSSTPADPLKQFLLDPNLFKHAFEMDRLASALFLDWGLQVTGARDLIAWAAQKNHSDRYSLETRIVALGGKGIILRKAVIECFRHEETKVSTQTSALQAWAVGYAASRSHMVDLLEGVPPIDTTLIDSQTLSLIAKVTRDGCRLRALKPTRTKNDVAKKCIATPGGVVLTSERYKSRVMASGSQRIEVTGKDSTGKVKMFVGKAGGVKGKAANIITTCNPSSNFTIKSVETVGREEQTLAEKLRANIILQILQHIVVLSDHPLVSRMWYSKNSVARTKKVHPVPAIKSLSGRELNDSQKTAVGAIIATKDAEPILVIHGPPGTGKTTVIAASVVNIIRSSDKASTVWLVAQSNVAVKNIAEKLASVHFLDFKILVSHGFHFDWHEHLYEHIAHNVIRSDEFEETPMRAERQLLGSRVILCTLSMLSNDRLRPIAHVVPLQTVIFDEASQIEIGDYIPLLVCFRSTLRKLVFIGDDKQLAPYGSGDIADLQSIFEKKHLREQAILLDTQYRMPIPIGRFISQHMYGGKLKSHHTISNPLCCRFVDVKTGSEESHGHSWKNTKEIAAAIAIARQLTSQNKSFRIITPYDPQRSLLEVGLKQANLPWEGKCFNVDAFQGNEDDYIIISLVRSHKLGFLRETRRVNVMLTRCKKGMAIVTSRKFVEGSATDSLIGKLCKSLPDSVWVDSSHVQNHISNLFL